MGTRLKNYIIPELVFIFNQDHDKDEVLLTTVNNVCDVIHNVSQEQILQAILEREKLSPTDIGNGIAVPHCRLDSVSDIIVAISVCPNGVYFSQSGKPVNIIFLVIGPQSKPEEYLFVLAQIARITSDKNLLLKVTHSESVDKIYKELSVFL